MNRSQDNTVKDHKSSYHVVHTAEPTDTSATTSPWVTGASKNPPWAGLLSLFGSGLVATAAMIAIVAASNRTPIENWRVQPSVLLAIASTAANVFVNFALSEGVTTAWWIRSLGPGTRVTDLHDVWALGTSLKSAVLAGTRFNNIALATILAAITPINGPFLQRALTVGSINVSNNITLNISAAQEFPYGYTGFSTGHLAEVAMITPKFSQIVKDYNAASPLNFTGSSCSGQCTGLLEAAGYQIDCVPGDQSFNLNPLLPGQSYPSPQTWIAFNGTDVFSTAFNFSTGYNPSSVINFSAIYKETDKCDGFLSSVNCTLQPALLKYHVIVVNDTIALDPSYSYKDDEVVRMTPANAQLVASGTQASTHGGMAFYLDLLYKSYAHLAFAGAAGYMLQTSGVPASQYTQNNMDITNCSINWLDPTSDMLSTARQLAFRVAITAANSSNATNVQTVNAFQQYSVTVYISHYEYLFAALLVTLTTTWLILPLFWNWWHLGRRTSMSPIEIARAFDAPALVGSDSNAEVKALLKEVGGRPIEYGARGSALGEQELVMGRPGIVQNLRGGQSVY